MNVKKELETKVGIANGLYLNNIEIDPFTIKAVMINELSRFSEGINLLAWRTNLYFAVWKTII